jgi:hypothetical protein
LLIPSVFRSRTNLARGAGPDIGVHAAGLAYRPPEIEEPLIVASGVVIANLNSRRGNRASEIIHPLEIRRAGLVHRAEDEALTLCPGPAAPAHLEAPLGQRELIHILPLAWRRA